MRKLIYIFTFLVLWVGDAQNLKTAIIAGSKEIVIPPPDPDPEANTTTTSLASDEYGLRTISWNDTQLPTITTDGSVAFLGGDFQTNMESSPGTVSKVPGKNQLRHYLNPLSPPPPQGWTGGNVYNMRAEYSDQPAQPEHPLGTVQWMGWIYTFGDNYSIDTAHPVVLMQNYDKISLGSPAFSLQINANPGNGVVGNFILVNTADVSNQKRYDTGVGPVAGGVYKIVWKTVYDDATDGLHKLWINDVVVVDEQERTVRTDSNLGGHNKWGIYKSNWRNLTGINESAAVGVDHIEIFTSPLRLLLLENTDPTRNDDFYSTVEPLE